MLIYDTSIRRILYDHLEMEKVSARWVPKKFSAVQRQRLVECALSSLEFCEPDPQVVLETITLCYDPLSKKELLEYSSKKKFLQKIQSFPINQNTDCEEILLMGSKRPH